MKVDGTLIGPAGTGRRLGERARGRRLRRGGGRSRVPTIRSSPTSSPPSTPREIELGTAIAVAFARNPMTLAHTAWDLQVLSERPVHPRARLADQAAHHEAVLDAVEPPGGADARADPGDPGDLGHVADRHAAAVSGRVLHAHADDAVLHAEPRRHRGGRRAADLPRRRRPGDDRGRRRGGRRVHLPPVHHRALPPRGDAAGA